MTISPRFYNIVVVRLHGLVDLAAALDLFIFGTKSHRLDMRYRAWECEWLKVKH